jgi:hypothetical protein
MNARESIEYIMPLLRCEREKAARLSLQGWPGEANHHRRQAAKLRHIIRHCETLVREGRDH